MNSAPLISLILITFNRRKFIETALKDLIEEKRRCEKAELIVIDGGSTDGTAEIIKKYSHELAYWVSEPDGGPADAFNKGVQSAKGELIRYAADDDRLVPGSTARLAQIMESRPVFDIVGGRTESVHVDAAGKTSTVNNKVPQGEVRFEQMVRPDIEGFIIPETCLFKKKVFAEGWDSSFGAACDFNFFLNALKRGVRIFISEEVFLQKCWHADSIVLRTMDKTQRAVVRSIMKYAGILPAAAYYYRVLLRPRIQAKILTLRRNF